LGFAFIYLLLINLNLVLKIVWIAIEAIMRSYIVWSSIAIEYCIDAYVICKREYLGL